MSKPRPAAWFPLPNFSLGVGRNRRAGTRPTACPPPPPCASSRFAKSILSPCAGGAQRCGISDRYRFDFSVRSESIGCSKRSSPLVPRGVPFRVVEQSVTFAPKPLVPELCSRRLERNCGYCEATWNEVERAAQPIAATAKHKL